MRKNKNKSEKRVYSVRTDMSQDDEYIVVVDTECKNVMKKVVRNKYGNYEDIKSIKIKWLRDVKPSDLKDLKIGELDCEIALIIGAYGYIDYGTCSKCDEEREMDKDNVRNNKLICNACIFDMENEEVK